MEIKKKDMIARLVAFQYQLYRVVPPKIILTSTWKLFSFLESFKEIKCPKNSQVEETNRKEKKRKEKKRKEEERKGQHPA
jgi:hypothetical protein